MFEQESKWIANELQQRIPDVSPVLNVGSSTLKFRTVEQPFIHREIIAPFEQKGGTILHLDMKQEEGVDFAGDLMDDTFRQKIKALNCKGILCSNLLEHVTNPKIVCDLLTEIVQPGGYIVITVPYCYPYHSDPIDTMFRPDIAALKELFPECEVVNGEILTIERTSFFTTLLKNPRLLVVTTGRALLPFYKFDSWKHIVSYIPDSFKPFQVTCVTFQKRHDG